MKRTRSFSAFGLLFTVLTAAACGGASDVIPPPPAPPSPPPAPADAGPITPVVPPAPAPEPLPPVTMTPGSPSPDPSPPAPTVKITAPSLGQVIATDKAADFKVKLDVKSWKTAANDAHIHLILDNQPYKPRFDAKEEVSLSAINGGKPLAEGHHVLVAFPSRANHESVKGAGALAITEFFVGKKGPKSVELGKPMLVYSRPKGTYNGPKANKVLLDFRVANTELSAGKNHVRIQVTGPGIESPILADATSENIPFYLEHLRNGEYTVKLDLLDSKSSPIPGLWNSTTRTIKIDHDADDAAAAPAAATPAAAPTPAASAPAAAKP